MDYFNNLLNNLSAQFGNTLPRVFGALAVLVIGLVIANIFRRVILALFRRTNIDERLSAKIKTGFRLDQFVSKLAYYLLALYVLLLTLDIMGIQSVLQPLQAMMQEFLGYIPNIVAAGIIGFVGYVIAKIVSEGVGLISTGLERFSAKVGMDGSMNLTTIVKQIVFLFVFIPILIVALDALKMTAISEPATAMLNQLMSAIPNILAAAVIMAVFFIGGRYVSTIVTQLLSNIGLDKFTHKLGIQSVLGASTLSKVIGNVIFFFLIMGGMIAAIDKLDLPTVSNIMTMLFNLSGQIFFGLVLLVVGNFIAGLVANSLKATNPWLSTIVRFALLGMFLAIALHTMGVAQSIVNLAFGLTLGSVAVAFALAFGLGGREAAGEEVSRFFNKMRAEENGHIASNGKTRNTKITDTIIEN